MRRNTALQARTPVFERSAQLKGLFNHHFALWKKRHGAGLEELAARCGVSSSYLSHIGRYGRVPGRPILILLALNFELKEPGELLRAAGMEGGWPFEYPMKAAPLADSAQGFLSVKLDLDGFADAIRSIVIKEARSRSIEEMTKGKPLRIGLNDYQQVIAAGKNTGEEDPTSGFFLDLCRMLAMTMRSGVEFVKVPFSEYRPSLERGVIDIFGPKLIRPQSVPALLSDPVCRIGHSALWRKRSAAQLAPLSQPKTIADLQRHPYQIAVLKDSGSQLFANVVLRKEDRDLLLCDSIGEAVERTVLTRLPRPAHLAILNGPSAVNQVKRHHRELELLFSTASTALEFSNNCFMVRPDWPELLPILNQSIAYLHRNGAIAEKISFWFPEEYREVIQPPRG